MTSFCGTPRIMSKRSAEQRPSIEGKVLRKLRQEQGLSMRKAGELIGISDSTIAHIENGRMNPPRGKKLLALLRAYGDITEESFYEKVRLFEEKQTPKEELLELVKQANEKQVEILLGVARGLMP
jgi:transcriptional regulator with XRE-family HTH domain